MENSHATKRRMKKEWVNTYNDGRRTQGGTRHWPPWVVQMICELLINGTAPTALPSTIQSIYETLLMSLQKNDSIQLHATAQRMKVELLKEKNLECATEAFIDGLYYY
jgi:hypothetical protein